MHVHRACRLHLRLRLLLHARAIIQSLSINLGEHVLLGGIHYTDCYVSDMALAGAQSLLCTNNIQKAFPLRLTARALSIRLAARVSSKANSLLVAELRCIACLLQLFLRRVVVQMMSL